jgi:hypothetical protein
VSGKTPKQKADDLQRWEGDFLAFLTECIYTTDEGSGEVRIAPKMRYLKEVYDCVENNKYSVIVKSRQMFFTHYFAAYYLWMVMFKENVRLGVMNQNEDDAADLLDTRIRPLYERLPEGYPWPKLEIKRLTIINEAMTSRIVATASTANKMRGKTFTRVWLDEFGFQENQEATLRSAMAAVKGPIAKLIINSTPVPRSLYEELGRKELDVNFEPIERMQGVTEYRNNRGHCVLYVHHTADPNKRSEEWIEETIKTEGELAYQVEYNLKWLLPVGKPVFKGFTKETYCRPYKHFGIMDGPRLSEGWDFGGHHPAWVCAQRGPVGNLVTHKAIMGVDMDLYDFMDLVEEIREREFGGMEYDMYCDPAGDAVNGQGTAPPAQMILEQRFKKKVRSIRSKPADRVRAMKQLMGKIYGGYPGLVLHPMLGEAYHQDGQVETGVMIEGFETGLVYDKLRGNDVGVHKLTYKKDQWFEHLFDALGYMFIYLYPGLMPADFEARMMEREKIVQHRKRVKAAQRKARHRR